MPSLQGNIGSDIHPSDVPLVFPLTMIQCGAIDLLMMERFQDQAINTYQQISKELRRQGAPLAFESPKRRYVIVGTSWRLDLPVQEILTFGKIRNHRVPSDIL